MSEIIHVPGLLFTFMSEIIHVRGLLFTFMSEIIHVPGLLFTFMSQISETDIDRMVNTIEKESESPETIDPLK